MSTSADAEGFAPAKPSVTFGVIASSDPVRFYPRHGVIPAVVEVRDQTGTWDAPGQSRTLILGDGSTVIERIEVADAARRFSYRLTDFTGFFGTLVAFATAEWDFDAAVEGTRIRWTYTFHAQPKRGWVVRLIVRVLWSRYMKRVLPALVDEVRRVSAG